MDSWAEMHTEHGGPATQRQLLALFVSSRPNFELYSILLGPWLDRYMKGIWGVEDLMVPVRVATQTTRGSWDIMENEWAST